jgi:hypothetical protein
LLLIFDFQGVDCVVFCADWLRIGIFGYYDIAYCAAGTCLLPIEFGRIPSDVGSLPSGVRYRSVLRTLPCGQALQAACAKGEISKKNISL